MGAVILSASKARSYRYHAAASPQQIALDEVGRQAIMADPAWNRGITMRPDSRSAAWLWRA